MPGAPPAAAREGRASACDHQPTSLSAAPRRAAAAAAAATGRGGRRTLRSERAPARPPAPAALDCRRHDARPAAASGRDASRSSGRHDAPRRSRRHDAPRRAGRDDAWAPDASSAHTRADAPWRRAQLQRLWRAVRGPGGGGAAAVRLSEPGRLSMAAPAQCAEGEAAPILSRPAATHACGPGRVPPPPSLPPPPHPLPDPDAAAAAAHGAVRGPGHRLHAGPA
jgi:hypothetical protein